jgi:hypothetical protein
MKLGYITSVQVLVHVLSHVSIKFYFGYYISSLYVIRWM